MADSRRTLAALLTRMEVQVLKCVANGLSDREIALRLLIFEPVVRAHIRSACEKLRVHGWTQASPAAGINRSGRGSPPDVSTYASSLGSARATSARP